MAEGEGISQQNINTQTQIAEPRGGGWYGDKKNEMYSDQLTTHKAAEDQQKVDRSLDLQVAHAKALTYETSTNAPSGEQKAAQDLLAEAQTKAHTESYPTNLHAIEATIAYTRTQQIRQDLEETKKKQAQIRDQEILDAHAAQMAAGGLNTNHLNDTDALEARAAWAAAQADKRVITPTTSSIGERISKATKKMWNSIIRKQEQAA